MVAEAGELVLPFAVIEREGAAAQEFPLEMTLATVLADVEKQREKSSMLRKREEVLEFTSVLYWPVIAIPWRENRHLVFDGMGVWSYVITQGRIPDANSFSALVDGAKDGSALLEALKAKTTFFDQFTGEDRVPIMGLFIHEELMRDILSHTALAKPRQISGNPLLTPRLSVEHSLKAAAQMRDVVEAMSRDADALSGATRSLESALARARTELASLRDATAKVFGKRIETIRPEINEHVGHVEKERDDRWSEMQPKLLDLQTQIRKLEADYAALDVESRRRDDLTAASQAKAQRESTRQGIEATRHEVSRHQNEMAQVRANYDRQIQAQWDRIREIERERDAEIARLSELEQAIVALVGRVSGSLGNLLGHLRDRIRFLDSQGVQAAVPGTTLIWLPIVVAAFAGARGRRLLVYPPMVARAGKGVLGGIKSTLGGAVLPLTPKTQQFEEIFKKGIEKAVADDASLAAYLASVGNENNLLHLGNLRELLRRGLAEMKAQGWIKDKHERELIQALERHVAAATRSAPRAGS